jgi:hypothetical protein
MNERKLRRKIRQIITEESDEDEDMIQGEEHDEEEDVEERVGVENAESGNYYNVKKSHALNNPQKYNKIRESALRRVVRKRIKEELSHRSLNEGARDTQELRDFMMFAKENGARDLDDRTVEMVADRIGAQPTDTVIVEQLQQRTVQNILQNPDSDMNELGGGWLLFTFGSGNPGIDLTKAVMLGDNNKGIFWLIYHPKNAK